MSGFVRSALFRRVLMMGAGLLLLATIIAAPTFTHGQAAAIPFGSASFAAQWGSIEPTVPNFWGPAVQPALQEPYVEATNGTRLVQYFDKARMEQTTAGGPVTNGLLTVELITGQRQMGDHAFAPFSPSSLPVVGDQTNPWPPYSALTSTVFAARVARSGEPTGIVYKPDGTFGLNPGLAAQPGAAFGDYQGDPGGTYAHNIPLAFSTYLAALPLPWQSAMGYPLTEAFWVNVAVKSAPTWVLVQPFERRVLSYTPTNPTAFQVEMGNIGQHYAQWRYATATAPADTPSIGTTGSATNATVSGTNAAATRTVAAASGTPVPLAIASVELGTATESTASLTFSTSIAATTEVLYGTSSHAYAYHQDISTTATTDHAVTLTGLQPGTKYYFALRAIANGTSIQRKEDYFATTGAAPGQPIAASSIATKVTPIATAIPTATPKPTATATTAPLRTISTTLTRITVDAASAALLSPAVVRLENASVLVSVTNDGGSGTAATLQPTVWNRDPVNPSASSTDALPPLTLPDKQATAVITATLTIPRADAGDPPLTVSYTRKMLVGEYGQGITFTTPPLPSTRAVGYTATLSFAISVG